MEAIRKSHKGSKFMFTVECWMVEAGEDGQVSITRGDEILLLQDSVDHEAKRLEVELKVVEHDGSVMLKYDEGRGPLVLKNAAISVVPNDYEPKAEKSSKK